MKKPVRKASKRFIALEAKINKETLYSVEEAIKLAKETATTKFDSAIEVHVRLGIDPKKSEQQIRSTAQLPHGTGKKIKIAVIADVVGQKEAQEAGATLIGGEELIDEIAKTKKTDFDVLVTTPVMMRNLAKVAKILGPKGMMPNPKNETVTPNIKKTVEELLKGKISFKNDDTSNIHVSIGKASFTEAQLFENYNAFIDTLKKLKPATSKGIYLQGIVMSSSMGPAIKVELK